MLSSEQLKNRKLGIGGSDAAAIAGMSKFKTALDVYIDKTSTEEKEQSKSEVLYWGNALEDPILLRYEEETGNVVTKYTENFKHKDHDFMLGNIDGFVKDKNILIEAKTSRFNLGWGDEWSADIPQEYLLQVAHYMSILDVEEAHIPVLFSGSDFKIFKYIRDKKIEKNLIDIESNFWYNNVRKLEPPKPVNLEDVRKRFRVSTGAEITVDNEVHDSITTMKSIKSKIKELKGIQDGLKFGIMDFMGEHSTLVNFDGSKAATWNDRKNKRFNLESFKEKHKNLYDEFSVESSSRTFLIK